MTPHKRRKRRKRAPPDINYYLRNLPEIKAWKLQCLEKYNGKCAITNKRDKRRMCVHHIIPHHILRNEILAKLNIIIKVNLKDYTQEEKITIAQMYVKEHQIEQGIPLLKKIHKLFHHHYGYNTTLDDFNEFRANYNNGLYDNTTTTNTLK